MVLITAHLPATFAFIRKYHTLFEEHITVPPETPVEHHVTLREGAPLLQMLEAPEDFIQGSAEPWIVDVLCALLKASDQRSVVETGAFMGATTLRLAQTLAQMGGGTIVACEIDPDRAPATNTLLTVAALPATVEWTVVQDDVMKYLASVPDESIGFSFVDDDHDPVHVFEELTLLLQKMVPKGLICGHDVWGSCNLQEVFAKFPNSLSLDLPRLGPAGGIGIIQV